jgi:rare lipoprotein A
MKKILTICLGLLEASCAGEPSVTASSSTSYVKNNSYHGQASWYQKGKRTADGQRFNPDKYSVAHRTLPFGTMLRLTNVENGNTIYAVVNDRGPFVKSKEIDVSRGAAKALGFFHSGTAKLLIEVLSH